MQAPSRRICMHAKIEGMLALESEISCIGFVSTQGLEKLAAKKTIFIPTPK